METLYQNAYAHQALTLETLIRNYLDISEEYTHIEAIFELGSRGFFYPQQQYIKTNNPQHIYCILPGSFFEAPQQQLFARETLVLRLYHQQTKLKEVKLIFSINNQQLPLTDAIYFNETFYSYFEIYNFRYQQDHQLLCESFSSFYRLVDNPLLVTHLDIKKSLSFAQQLCLLEKELNLSNRLNQFRTEINTLNDNFLQFRAEKHTDLEAFMFTFKTFAQDFIGKANAINYEKSLEYKRLRTIFFSHLQEIHKIWEKRISFDTQMLNEMILFKRVSDDFIHYLEQQLVTDVHVKATVKMYHAQSDTIDALIKQVQKIPKKDIKQPLRTFHQGFMLESFAHLERIPSTLYAYESEWQILKAQEVTAFNSIIDGEDTYYQAQFKAYPSPIILGKRKLLFHHKQETLKPLIPLLQENTDIVFLSIIYEKAHPPLFTLHHSEVEIPQFTATYFTKHTIEERFYQLRPAQLKEVVIAYQGTTPLIINGFECKKPKQQTLDMPLCAHKLWSIAL